MAIQDAKRRSFNYTLTGDFYRSKQIKGILMSFIQIHALTSYHPSLLNRDDAGFAKRIPYGGLSNVRGLVRNV